MLEKPRLKDGKYELPEVQALNIVVYVKIKIVGIYGQVTSRL